MTSGYNIADFTTTGTQDARITFGTPAGTKGTVGWSPFNSTMALTTIGADDISFDVNNLNKEVMRVAATGKVGIGITVPTTQLDVEDATDNTYAHLAGSFYGVYGGTTSSGYGYLGAGTLGGIFGGNIGPDYDNQNSDGSASYRWTSVYATNGTIQTSDKRDKENITDLTYGLKEIMQLHPVSFTWKDNPSYGKKLGLLAQEVEPILGEVVKKENITTGKASSAIPSSDYRYGIYYSDIIPVLIKGMQEQQAEIEALKLQIKALQK